MQKAVNYLRGTVRAEVECRYPENFLNICAQEGVEFWDMERTEEKKLHLTVSIQGYTHLRALAAEYDFRLRRIKKSGIPFFLWKIRKRYVLLAGMLMCVFLVWLSSLFVWQIEVIGNEKVPSSLILRKLEELGVHIGACHLGISQEYISNEMLQIIPELSWLTVNTGGSRMQVLVREDIPRPEIVNQKEPTVVLAAKSGIITKITVLNGTGMFKAGDTVAAGDLLVSSEMGSISSGTREVHAMAEVFARTWYESAMQIPLNMYEKEYTGAVDTKYSLIIAGNRVNLYFTSGNLWPKYDKITTESQLTIFSGTVLPFSLVKQEYRAYNETEGKLSRDEAEKLLEARLLEKLQKEIGDGEILETWFYSSIDEKGVVTVKMTAECHERIDLIKPAEQAGSD